MKIVKEIINLLLNNEIVIIPTDTIYGISAVFSEENKIKINKLKKSNVDKKIIVIYASKKIIQEKFNITNKEHKIMKKNKRTTFFNFENNNCDIALRHVNNKFLKKILKKVGLLYSTSANLTNISYIEDVNIFKRIVKNDNVFFFKKSKYKNSKIYDLKNKLYVR